MFSSQLCQQRTKKKRERWPRLAHGGKSARLHFDLPARAASTSSFLPPTKGPQGRWSPANELPSKLGFVQSQQRSSRSRKVTQQQLALAREGVKVRLPRAASQLQLDDLTG